LAGLLVKLVVDWEAVIRPLTAVKGVERFVVVQTW
jgi:hypothetical protein